MHEEILSVGVDIGTSTTQLVFSRLIIENQATSFTAPRINIVEKIVEYRSDIYMTPLKSPTEIDAEKIKRIVKDEYAKAGHQPKDISTGAVIITGETARKENANEVLSALSDMAGDFVVATAGPDLESVLAARGAGTDIYSKERRTVVANLDVGGGTTNIGVYEKGKLVGVCCLDIGGRLIKVENGIITYVFHKISDLAQKNGIKINVGDKADTAVLSHICELMADQLAQAIGCKQMDGSHLSLYTNDGKPLPQGIDIKAITYSGGVADYVYGQSDGNVFRYGDIGVILGEAIRKNKDLAKKELLRAVETIRATVVGAGTHTTEISGSTISYDRKKLPLKNVPIIRVSEEEEKSLETFEKSIRTQLALYKQDGKIEQVAIAFTGTGRTGFNEIQALAEAVIRGAQEVINSPFPLLLVIENDIAKALGQAILVKLENRKDVVCIDGIAAVGGDYIDVGEPIGAGSVLPVVVKTLIFNSL
ncbi:MAG: ethanolamine ammonia-lyase reactivating factor EutA [Clostridiales bacterium]|nr:ethanolamine ammonia-lyase reactivating factor EutA [Clostridiales bacterium]